MPTYQYACTACDERLEVVQKFTDDSLTTCEVCGGSLRKVYSPVGIVFKGSGFYRTDSRNGSGSGEAKDKPEAKEKEEEKPKKEAAKESPRKGKKNRRKRKSQKRKRRKRLKRRRIRQKSL